MIKNFTCKIIETHCLVAKASINGSIYFGHVPLECCSCGFITVTNSNEMLSGYQYTHSIVLYMDANTELSFLPAGGVAAGAAGVEDGIITIVEKTFTC